MPKHRKVQKTRGRRKGAKVTRRKRGGDMMCTAPGYTHLKGTSNECAKAWNLLELNSTNNSRTTFTPIKPRN